MRVEGLFAKEQGSLTDRYIVRSTSVQRGIINDYGNQRTNIQSNTTLFIPQGRRADLLS